MALVDIDWHPGPRDLRKFGLWVLAAGVVLTLTLGALSAPATAIAVVVAIAGSFGLIGLTGTRAALPPYRLWMGASFVIGNVVGYGLMAALYFGIVVPMGLAMRLLGRDRLAIRRPRESYWVELPGGEDPARYERQF